MGVGRTNRPSHLRPEGWWDFTIVLYWNSRFTIARSCATFADFQFTAGVRQRCPLSPILFAMLSDVLLRRLSRSMLDALPRAYADDLTIAFVCGVEDAPIMEQKFDEYERFSGFRLHQRKKSSGTAPVDTASMYGYAPRLLRPRGMTSRFASAHLIWALWSAQSARSIRG